ncbi:MAG: hypothetical protein JWO95_2417 [Verrucomicrobiales bacterium]|nr:hypothetical protein [Verrucomicrobiales bacterium]
MSEPNAFTRWVQGIPFASLREADVRRGESRREEASGSEPVNITKYQ